MTNTALAHLLADIWTGWRQPLPPECAPGNVDLLYRRLDALGVDVSQFTRAPLLRADLELTCANCECKLRCMRDLARRPDDKSWTRYCPNEPALRTLAR